MPVAIGADHDGADRPHEEADAVDREGLQQGYGLVALGKEVGGDLGGEQPIYKEVVQLDEIADGAGDDRPPPGGGVQVGRARR